MNNLQTKRIVINVIIEAAKNCIFDDSPDENEEILEKVHNYAECTVPCMSDRQFQMHFRMSPDTFEDMLGKLHSVQYENNELVRQPRFPKTSLEKEALITTWYLSNIESFRSVADRFGISKSTCWDILYRTCKDLLRINKKFKIISWPLRDRQEEIKNYFQRTTGFPGIIGCIDGSHIQITAPKQNHNSYINRKNFHSVLLQGVCDHRKLFTSVYAGEAGSIHDYTLYRRSPLHRRILNGEITFYEDNHLVGDLAYKLHTNLMVGFKNNGHLDERQKNFNFTLSRARVTIEMSFALLKGRFRRMKMLETVRLDLISLLIVSGCILHNICILKGDLLEDIINIVEELREEINLNPANPPDILFEEANNIARIKRNDIVNALPRRQRE